MLWQRIAQRKNNTTGQIAENCARNLLEQHGLRTLTQNFRCKTGEIDVIMLDNDCIVFVEVRYRRQSKYGSALESVDQRKQRRVRQTALFFLQQHPKYQEHSCRFDVVALSGSLKDVKYLQNEWVKNAFQ